MAILEGLYWLQEALKLVVEEVASRLAGLATASSFEVVATLSKVLANYYNYYNHLIVAIDYYHHNYEVGLEEYLILEPKAFIEQHKGFIHFHQLP